MGEKEPAPQPDDLPFDEVVRRHLVVPAHHVPAKPPQSEKQKKPAPKRKPR
jgi:hypothetical protein